MTTQKLIYISGIGYVTPKYKEIRDNAKKLIADIKESLGSLPYGVCSIDYRIMDEETSRVRILIDGYKKSILTSLKWQIIELLRSKFPGVDLRKAKVNGYDIWCLYFSDGNFNNYCTGVDLFLTEELYRKQEEIRAEAEQAMNYV